MTAQLPVWVNVWRLGNLLLVTVLIAVSSKLAYQRLRRRTGGGLSAGVALLSIYAWTDVLDRYKGHVPWSWTRSPLLGAAATVALWGFGRDAHLRPTAHRLRWPHKPSTLPLPVSVDR